MQPAAAVVEDIVVIPSAARKAYNSYFDVFHMLLAAHGESSPSAGKNFQYVVAWQHKSDESHQINRIRGEIGVLPQWNRD
jgi:hypothetical protein